MPISDKFQCIFVHVPKTGGTSIESALGLHFSWEIENQEALYGLIQSEELLKYGFLSGFLQHLTLPQIRRLKSDSRYDAYYSFSFVRNPWDRMVSVFSKPDPHMVQQAARSGINLRGNRFEQFLDKTRDIEHIHLQPQSGFIFDDDELLVDFVGRFEQLETDFRKVCEQIGVQKCLAHKNISKHDHYRAYYNEKTKKIVAGRYERDIDLFHYSF